MNINDIAKMAGVSKATVSRVLNDIKVRPEYKEKVQRVLKETGYKPNRIARELATKKTKLIGLVLPSIKPNVFSYVVEGLTQVLNEKGYSLILSTTNNKGLEGIDNEIEIFNFMRERQVEGLLYIPQIVTSQLREFLSTYDVPMVTIGENLEELSISSVVYDDYHAAKSIVKYLVELGHRHIGYIGLSELYHASGYMRKQGYLDALEEAGLEKNPELILEAGFTHKEGYTSAKTLLTSQSSRVTAIFAGLDRLAFGVMSYIMKAGYAIPEDISVVGIDDDETSSYYYPPLTTVYYDYVKTGQIAGQMIIEKIEQPDIKVKHHTMDFLIKERNSVM